jgi:hypothetical protein
LWFLLKAISVIFVAWDIRSTPESPPTHYQTSETLVP